MHEEPSVEELIEAVKSFITETAAPQLTGHSAFHARVAVNALDIALRDMTSRATDEAYERSALQNLLDDNADDLKALNEALCQAIRSGKMNWRTPGLADFLTETAKRQMAIDQPRYSGYRAALKLKPGS